MNKKENFPAMTRPEAMLLDLLYAGLNGRLPDCGHEVAVGGKEGKKALQMPDVFADASPEDWKECRKQAIYHGVMALVWDGACLLPEDRQMPHAMKLAWGLAVQEYEKRYEYYCKTAQELSEFYARQGIGMMQMKGVGFSSYYPHPSHREGGDIDIYTYDLNRPVASSSEEARNIHLATDQAANDRAETLMEQMGIEVDRSGDKHHTFYYQGIHIENHKHFLGRSFPLSVQVDDLLYELAQPHEIGLLGGKYQEKTASTAFYTLFLAFHAFQHYGSGFVLHHVADWAILLQNGGLQLPEEVKDPHLVRFVNTLTLFTNRYLGTSVPVAGDERLLERMTAELLHPVYDQHTPAMSRPKLLLYKTRRLLYRLRQQKDLMGISILGGIGSSLVAHLKAPKTIFGTN